MKGKDQQQTSTENEFDDDCQFIFPQRLMSVLSDESNSDAICWLPHGRAFIIRNKELFAEKVMPKFFPRKSKYSSFTRKLNRWNFVRVSSGPELGAYYHEFFLRDKPHLAAQMFCKNARTKIAMASSDPKPTAALVAENQLMDQSQRRNSISSTGTATRLTPSNIMPVRQQVDPALMLLLEQQLSLHTTPTAIPAQPAQDLAALQNPIVALLLREQQQKQQQQQQNSILQQLELQKKHQENMLNLQVQQQLMALNLQRYYAEPRKNPRASAA